MGCKYNQTLNYSRFGTARDILSVFGQAQADCGTHIFLSLFFIKKAVENERHHAAEEAAADVEHEPAYAGYVERLHKQTHKEELQFEFASVTFDYSGI